jgi:hypothetical protein
MTNKSTGNVGLTYSPEGLDDRAFRPTLDILRHIVLNWSWLWQIKVLPTEKQEVPEVL